MPERYVLGVDGGGTWTRCIIMGLDGSVASRGRSGPSNPITIGVDKAYQNIVEAVDNALKPLGVEGFEASVLGLAGIARSKLREELAAKLPDSFGVTRIVSDARSALAGATGCKPGVVVIAGTGSICFGLNPEGEEARAGGWGWRLGDEGSGYTIGRNALLGALRDHDQSGPPTVLKRQILMKLGLENVEDVIDWTYARGREPRHFAELVPLVKAAEDGGDIVATRIMADAGAELGKITQAVIQRLKLYGGFPVACCGGVFQQPRGYNAAFERMVRMVGPDCVFIEPMFSPTVGSGLLALEYAGVRIGGGLLNVVKNSGGRIDV